MEAFTVKCKIDNIETSLIAYPLNEQHTRFKLENITGQHDPMFIVKDDSGHWLVEKDGAVNIPQHAFQECCGQLEKHLTQK